MRRRIRSANGVWFYKAKEWLGLVKTIIEVLAIIVAGFWAYSKYIKIEKPLEIRNSSSGYLEWSKLPTQNVCMATLGVTIKNIGTVPFSIEKVTLDIWSIDSTKINYSQSYFSPLNEKNKVLVLEKKLNSDIETSLLGVYAVDEENHNDFSFVLNNSSNLIYYFRARITGQNVNIEEGRWGFACDISPNSENRI